MGGQYWWTICAIMFRLDSEPRLGRRTCGGTVDFLFLPVRLGTFQLGWILVGHCARLGAALFFLWYTRSRFFLVWMWDTP